MIAPLRVDDRPIAISNTPRAYVAESAEGRIQTERVASCYSLFDVFFPRLGFLDLTEGIYDSPNTSFDQAQANQHDYLLNEIQCNTGNRVLDIGCGYGTLLARARNRGAKAIGITLSAEQLRYCLHRGIETHLLDYRTLGPEWAHSFDGVIANGSAEHFVQIEDAAAGRSDAIYRAMFHTVHNLIDPDSPARRFVTTIIHLYRPISPCEAIMHPFRLKTGSDAYHMGLLARSFGGWYPAIGQLERCAAGYFDLVSEVDGTEDYRRTSEVWLGQVREKLSTRDGMEAFAVSFPNLLRHAGQFLTMIWCMLISESWNWQFRPPAPTRLLRQTWEYRE